jgi:hypothetical protein
MKLESLSVTKLGGQASNRSHQGPRLGRKAARKGQRRVSSFYFVGRAILTSSAFDVATRCFPAFPRSLLWTAWIQANYPEETQTTRWPPALEVARR